MKHIYANSVTEWYVAESIEQAKELARLRCEEHGIDVESQCFDFEQWPDERPLSITLDGDLLDKPTVKTCAEWAAESAVGFLASTEW